MDRSTPEPNSGSGVAGHPQRFKGRERVLTQRSSDAILLLSVDDGNYFALNEVGGRIWELCDGGHGVDDIIAVVCDEYEAPRDRVQEDVVVLLGELQAEGLIDPV
jgi:hypothetical protein